MAVATASAAGCTRPAAVARRQCPSRSALRMAAGGPVTPGGRSRRSCGGAAFGFRSDLVERVGDGAWPGLGDAVSPPLPESP